MWGCRACGLGCECGGEGGVELVVWGVNKPWVRASM